MTAEDEESVLRELEELECQEADNMKLKLPHAPAHRLPEHVAAEQHIEENEHEEDEHASSERSRNEPLLA
ncbi:hypothetical protein LPJ75_006701 [Coemansia sp. RSA 2598]|nr:hypothetical protein LPJ75_006701 [Coemansia sp. RSA 2598]